MKLRTGDLVVEHTKFKWNKITTYLSAIIRLFQWWSVRSWKLARWNHSGVILVDADGLVWVMDATAKGIVIRTFERWERAGSKEWQVYRPQFFYIPEEKILKELREALGTPYDYWALLTQAIYIITLGVLWIGPKHEKASKKIYCSEFWAYVYRSYFTEWWKKHTADLLKETNFTLIDEGKYIRK